MHEMHNQYHICPSVSFTSQLLNVILMKISVGVHQQLSNELKKGSVLGSHTGAHED
jgi:hypothetical protein